MEKLINNELNKTITIEDVNSILEILYIIIQIKCCCSNGKEH